MVDDIEHGKIDRKIRRSEWYTVIPYDTKRERHERTTRIKRSRMVRKAHNSQREPQRKEERIAAGFTRKK